MRFRTNAGSSGPVGTAKVRGFPDITRVVALRIQTTEPKQRVLTRRDFRPAETGGPGVAREGCNPQYGAGFGGGLLGFAHGQVVPNSRAGRLFQLFAGAGPGVCRANNLVPISIVRGLYC